MEKSYKNKKIVCLGGWNAIPKAFLAGFFIFKTLKC